VTIENTISDAAASRAVAAKHGGPDQRLGLVPAAVEADDGRPRCHEPRHDADAHGAEPDETDVHSF
jgi:hypothetical protein